VTLGAYYRLRPSIVDFQVAVTAVGAVLVSARVHRGWIRPKKRRIGRIPPRRGQIGAHAFVIVGYDRDGFLIANSWGEDWAAFRDRPGLAHWSYGDWAENLIDAWVMRLAPSAPKAFDIMPRIARHETASASAPGPAAGLPRPRRYSLIGHLVQAELDGIVHRGRTGIGLESLRETALYLASGAGRKNFPHLLFVFHDPFLGPDTLVRLAGHMIES